MKPSDTTGLGPTTSAASVVAAAALLPSPHADPPHPHPHKRDCGKGDHSKGRLIEWGVVVAARGETHRRKQKSKVIHTNVYRKETCEEREDTDIQYVYRLVAKK